MYCHLTTLRQRDQRSKPYAVQCCVSCSPFPHVWSHFTTHKHPPSNNIRIFPSDMIFSAQYCILSPISAHMNCGASLACCPSLTAALSRSFCWAKWRSTSLRISVIPDQLRHCKLMLSVINTENKGIKVVVADWLRGVLLLVVFTCVDRQELHCNSRYPCRRGSYLL